MAWQTNYGTIQPNTPPSMLEVYMGIKEGKRRQQLVDIQGQQADQQAQYQDAMVADRNRQFGLDEQAAQQGAEDRARKMAAAAIRAGQFDALPQFKDVIAPMWGMDPNDPRVDEHLREIPGPEEAQSLADALDPPSGGATEYGTSAIPFEDANGGVRIGQMSKNGGISFPQTPEGYNPILTATTINAGDRIIQRDRAGRVISETDPGLAPKDTVEHQGAVAEEKARIETEKKLAQTYPKTKNRLAALDLRHEKILLPSIDKAVSQISALTTGPAGRLKWISGGPPKNLAEILKPIRANIGFDQLADMRADSPTGGALGNVSNYDIENLQGVLGSLDQEQSPSQLISGLEQVKDYTKESARLRREAFNEDYASVIEKRKGKEKPDSGGLPDAAAHKGRTITNGQTRLTSDGTNWIPAQ